MEADNEDNDDEDAAGFGDEDEYVETDPAVGL
jgi:hypothetical protein